MHPGGLVISDTPLFSLVSLVHREALSSVFTSQVLTPLKEHQNVANVSLGLLTPVGHLCRSQYRPALREIESQCHQAGISLGWIPSPPSRTRWLWSEAFVLRQWIARRFRTDQPFLVRCRNATMTGIALEALKSFHRARVIYDCRGAETTELIQQCGVADQPPAAWPPAVQRAVRQAARRECRAVTESAGVTCVSSVMARVLQQRYPDVPGDKFRVVPCCPDVASFRRAIPERVRVRQALGLADRFVVTYLGSLAWYQQLASTLRLFQLIQQIRPDAHFLAITTAPEQLLQLATQSGLAPEAMTIRSVAAHDVPGLLVASDLGLMLRDDSETNRVASPVKFGEYLAAGVPVVITPRLGDCSEIVREHQLGIEVELARDNAWLVSRLREFFVTLKPEMSLMRARCIEYAEAELSWPGLVPRLATWYAQLLNSPAPQPIVSFPDIVSPR